MEKAKEAPKSTNVANVSKEASKAAIAAKAKETSLEVSFAEARLTAHERQIACLRARGIVLWSVE